MGPNLDAYRIACDAIEHVWAGNGFYPEYSKAIQAQPLNQRVLISEVVNHTLRRYPYLTQFLNQFLTRKIPRKQKRLQTIMCLGMGHLSLNRSPAPKVINTWVELAKCEFPYATGTVNKCLRAFLDLAPWPVEASPPLEGIQQLIQQDWPEHWAAISKAIQHRPPMTLRVNQSLISREDFLSRLQALEVTASTLAGTPYGIAIEGSVILSELPGYDAGWFAVQDYGAQWASWLLSPKPNEVILDACAAPGGKTAALYHQCPKSQLTAIEKDPKRFERLLSNCERQQVKATLLCQDVSDRNAMSQLDTFDKILCDSPCSASGVLKRHPDVAFSRSETDIQQVQAMQLAVLNGLWPNLRKGGILIYSTCSLLRAENDGVIAKWLATTQDAVVEPCEVTGAIPTEYGQQLLPTHNQDGFYFARICKQ